MTIPHDERLELAAAAIRAQRGLYGKPNPSAISAARAAIAAYLGNDVVVPREPTHEMLDALYEADTTGNPVDGWEAMLAASPLAERGKR